MSIIKKTSIALAMAAAFGLAAPAMAIEIGGLPTQPATVANVSVDTAGDVSFGTNVTLSVSLSAQDTMLARTTGVNFTITLPAGVTFSGSPTVTAEDGAGEGDWDASIASQGPGFIIVSLAPNVANPSGLDLDGPLFTVTNWALTGATGLRTAGGSVAANLKVTDANSGNPVTGDASTDFTLVTSAYPLSITYNANGGNTTGRIDVGTGKIGFSWYGNILADTTTPEAYFADGQITYATVAGLLDAGTGDSYYTVASNVTGLDLTTSLSGDFSSDAFVSPGGIFIAKYSGSIYCSAHTSGADFAFATDHQSASSTYSLSDLNVTSVSTAGGQSWTRQVCFAANGDQQIGTTSVAASTSSDGAATATGSLLPLLYNGSVAFVPVFNPAANPTAQSFLRVINPSNTDGKVTITGTDDSGNSGAGTLTFTLGAGQSMQINSDDMEAGNADKGLIGGLGDGAGKWRLDVTGEFNNMRVQSLNRNSSTGTVTDLSGEVISTGSVNDTVDKGITHLQGGGFPLP